MQWIDPQSQRAGELWRSLADAEPPSYFLSWGWVENWLASLPPRLVPRLAVLGDGASACFLARRLALHHRAIPSRALYLNATGDKRFDDLWIEYNALVGRDVPLDDFLAALPRDWDEVVLPGVRQAAFGGLTSRHRIVRRDVPSYFVDLGRVRERGYPALLSSGTRSQLRRAQREAGRVEITVARDEPEAIDIFTELAALHAVHWRARNLPGAFADPWVDRFHRRLIARRFRHGEIQLVRVRNSAGTIGCLYNFVWRSRVLQYQSGLASYADPHQKPGYVCHAAAIEHAATCGLDVYDFLGGEMRYKKSLSTGHEMLVWATVQRPRLRFALESRLVEAWRARRPPSADARG